MFLLLFTFYFIHKMYFPSSSHIVPVEYIKYAAAAIVVYLLGTLVYNVFFHPLRAVPGPFAAKLSRWWLFRLEMRGNPHPEILELHRKYGRLA